jgi:hypothetical protein
VNGTEIDTLLLGEETGVSVLAGLAELGFISPASSRKRATASGRTE